MPADVEEGPHLTGARTADQHALVAHLDSPERTRLVEVGRSKRAEPHRLEDLRLLHGEDGGVGVIAARQRRDQALRQSDGGHRDLLCWNQSQAGTGTEVSWRRQRVNSFGWSTPSTATGSPPRRYTARNLASRMVPTSKQISSPVWAMPAN